MKYDPAVRHYNCKSCGLSLTSQEILEAREKMRPHREEDDERTKRRKEYLDWWFSRRE
jgi:hypothetical protein